MPVDLKLSSPSKEGYRIISDRRTFTVSLKGESSEMTAEELCTIPKAFELLQIYMRKKALPPTFNAMLDDRFTFERDMANPRSWDWEELLIEDKWDGFSAMHPLFALTKAS
jgi:hypothetical protein